MHGLHLTADLSDCPAGQPLMTDGPALRRACLAAVREAGLQAVGELFHPFAPAASGAACPGITGMVLLAESHLAVHTWPELGAATLDVYVCNLARDNSAKARQLLDALIAGFAPGRVERHSVERGEQLAGGVASIAPVTLVEVVIASIASVASVASVPPVASIGSIPPAAG